MKSYIKLLLLSIGLFCSSNTYARSASQLHLFAIGVTAIAGTYAIRLSDKAKGCLGQFVVQIKKWQKDNFKAIEEAKSLSSDSTAFTLEEILKSQVW